MKHCFRFIDELKGILLSASRILLAVVIALIAVLPVAAQSPDTDVSISAVTLIPAKVTSDQINHYFDLDGTIVVNDMTDVISPAGTLGDAFLQTRLFPKGEAGTPGASLYAYLYRVDMTRLTSTTTEATCVGKISLPFGMPVSQDYDKDRVNEDYFIISEGGALGSVSPTAVIQYDEMSLIIEFKDPVCSGIGNSAGQSSFFIGFSSYEPYRFERAQITLLPSGISLELDTRVPYPKGPTPCALITDPSEIPSPATINFDSLPDEQIVGTSYNSKYGVTFIGPKAEALTSPFSARSVPNVAFSPWIAVAATMIKISFSSPASHVGFYAGNTSRAAAEALTTAWQVIPGIPDVKICESRITLPPESLDTFIGFYDPANRISRVELSIPQTTNPVILDDLQFRSSASGAPTEFSRSVTPLSGDGPDITINRSDNTRFAATFNLPDPSLWIEQQPDGDKPRLRFALPGTEINGNLGGYPDVPLIRRLIAVPEGSTPVLAVKALLASQEFIADLYPSQPPAMDADSEFADPPYAFDQQAYSTNANFPLEPVSIIPVGKMRDLNLALLVIAGGQYNPVTRKLTIFKQVDADVIFQGGTGAFLPNYSNNPFEPDIRKMHGDVLNVGDIGSYLGALPIGKTCWGTELYIFSHPTFVPAANTLAEWKIEKGISTTVLNTGHVVYNTPAKIKAYIQSQFDFCVVRPSYVLLLGDAEKIGAFPHDYPNDAKHSSRSDIDYALMDGEGDVFPDLAYGRIPVDTLTEADNVVKKIINYEKYPPDSTNFYKTVTIASFFECCLKWESDKAWDSRSFVESSEAARAALVAAGKTVIRVYKTSMNLNFYKPSYYRNGASLPSGIGYTSGYPWSGSTADIVNAINNGTGIIMHRDHGWWQGWADPIFESANISALDNGRLTPVVYSINCSSGVWDNEIWTTAPMYPAMTDTDVSWIEKMIREPDGAVALIGDTRNSPTWANSALARGLFDATWPATDPSYGDNSVHFRLGDILNYAKLYMYSQVTIPQTAGEVTLDQALYNNVIYHVIGDPSLSIWKNQPLYPMPREAVYHWVSLTGFSTQSLLALPALTIEYPEDGAVITILQNGLPVGRGTVAGGVAPITFVADFNPTLPLQVSACLDEEVCVELTPPWQQVYLPMIKR